MSIAQEKYEEGWLPELPSERVSEITDSIARELTQEVDWKSYYDRFVVSHGGEPEQYAGRQLFRDGWSYALDYRGPEWPPPSDPKELKWVVGSYWSLRSQRLQIEATLVKRSIENYKDAQEGRSQPLYYKYVTKDSDRVKIQSGPIDLDILESRLRRIKMKLQECQVNLESL